MKRWERSSFTDIIHLFADEQEDLEEGKRGGRGSHQGKEEKSSKRTENWEKNTLKRELFSRGDRWRTCKSVTTCKK